MRGIVVARSLRENLVFVLVEDDCTITTFYTADCEDFQHRDFVTGDLHTLGGEDITNLSGEFISSAVVENIFATPKPIYLPYYELFSIPPNK